MVSIGRIANGVPETFFSRLDANRVSAQDREGYCATDRAFRMGLAAHERRITLACPRSS
ncbi:MAG: hypothetical protein ACRDRJ_03420 [Streptosporangiaceae bacterium]